MKRIVFIILILLIGITISAQTISYTYDKSGRLTSYSASDTTYQEYTYDQDGNRIKQEKKTGSLTITQKATNNSLLVYPNPSNNLLYCDAPLGSSNIVYALTDIQGRAVLNGSINVMDNKTFSVDVSSLVPSIYFLQVIDRDMFYWQKIIISR